jgi:3-phenylpropionate/trans-cinnamate dioxygenase ferredoxin component
VISAEANGVPLVIARSEGEVFALDEYCTHEDVSLADGEVYDHTVECWLHGSCFDLRTGKPTGPPASKPLGSYSVTIDGDDVYVALGEA